MIVYRVASASDYLRKEVRSHCLKRINKRWLVISEEEIMEAKSISHGKKVNLDHFDAIWIDHWPALYSREQFLFDLFGDEHRLIIFAQKYNFSLLENFFQTWTLTLKDLYKDKLLKCYYSPWQKIVREYAYSYPNRVTSTQDFCHNSLQYLRQINEVSPQAFYASEAGHKSSFYLFIHGRQRPKELLISKREDKARRPIDQKNALSRQSCDWRAFTALWSNGVSAVLWRSRRWQKTKKLYA